MRLKHLLSVFLTLLTLSVGQMWGAGTETFEAVSSYTNYSGTRTWTGVNGQTWSATSARTDQKITGNRGITCSSSGGTITMVLTTAQKNAGIGALSFNYKHPFSDSGKSNTVSISVNGSNYSTSSLSYTSSSKSTSITVNAVPNSTSLTITISGDGRLCVDDFSWTSYTACSNSVSITASSATHGTISASKSSLETCSVTDADRQITVTVTPSSGYGAPSNLTLGGSITPEKINGPTSNGAGAFTYLYQFAKNDNGSTSFSATCPELQKYEVSFSTGTGNSTVDKKKETSVGGGITLPSGPSTIKCSSDGWEFAGWSETEVVSETETASLLTAGSSYFPDADITLYAVYRHASISSTPSSVTYTLNGNWTTDNGNWTKVDGSNLNSSLASGKYGLNSGSSTAVSPVAVTDISEIRFTGTASKTGTGTVAFYYGSGNSWTLIESKSFNTSLTWSPSPTVTGQLKCIFSHSDGNIYIASIKVTGKFPSYTYVSSPTCCSPLGTINGSVSFTNGEATVSFEDLANVTGWGLKYKKSSDSDIPANWSTYSGSFSSTNSIRSNSTAISGLVAGSQYDFKVTGSYTGSIYCTGAFEAALYPTSSYYVPQMEDPSVSSITGLGYIVEAASSTAQSFTISASHLTGNLRVDAPNTNFEVSTTSATTGFGSYATLTPTSGSLTNAEVWVRLATGLAVNTYGGNTTYVTITGGGAAGKQVSVTGSVSPACENPDITAQTIADATYNLNATATPLTVTAQKHSELGSGLTYQWMQCATKKGTYVNAVGGTGSTSYSYTPPTTAAGSDLYYTCVVSSGACSVSSDTAHIQINTPVIKLNDATDNISLDFEDKAVDATTGYTLTFNVSGQYLGENIGIAKSGTNEAMFTLSASSVSQTDGTAASTTITVTYKPSATGSHSATLTLSSDQATERTVTLNGTGKWKATFMNGTNLEEHSSVLVADGSAPSKPGSNPAVCDAVSTSFVGWTQSTWTGRKTQSEVDELTAANVKIYKSGDNLPAMTDHVTYYPVFAKDGSTETEKTIEFTTTNLSSYAAVDDTYGGIAFKSTGKFGKQTWSTKEYIQCENGKVLYNSAAFPGYIKSITITPESPAGVSGSAQLAVGTSSQPTSYSSDITSESTTNYTSSNAYTYLAIKANGATALRKISITYTAISASYSEYITTCLNCTVNPTIGASSNSNVTVSNATVSCAGITKGTCDIDEYGFFYKSGESGVTKDDTKIQISNAVSDDDVSSFSKAFVAGDLTPNTHYYFKPYAKVNGVYYLGSETDFATKSITVTSNNNTYGTVSGSGLSWTGAPATGYTYAETAYTLSSGNNTTVGIVGNAITVTSTSTADVAIVINFAAKPTYTITLNAGNGSVTADGWIASEGVWTKTQANGDAAIIFPSANAGCAGWNFVGWATAAADNADSDPTSKAEGDDLVPESNVTYYAVYQQSTPGGTTYNKITKESDLTTGDYAFASSSGYAMGKTVVNSRMTEKGSSFTGSSITIPTDTLRWTIIKFGSQVLIRNKSNSKFLGISSTGVITCDENPHLFTYAYNTTNNRWEFTSAVYTTYQLIYGGSTAYFRAGTAQSTAIYLYKQGAETGNYYTNPSCSGLAVAGVANPGAGGSVLVSAASAKVGEKVYAYYDIDEAYKFDNWSVSEGSSLSSTSAQLTEVTIGGSTDVTITANFTKKAVATVKFYNNGVQVGTDQEVVEGIAPIAPTLTDGHVDAGGNACDENSTTHYGWTKKTWIDTKDKATVEGMTGDNTVYVKNADLPEIAAGDDDKTIEYHAVWMNYEAPANTYKKGTASDLTAGQTVLIVNGNSSVALKGASDAKGALSVIISENKITTTNTNVLWTVTPHNSGYYFKYGNNFLNSYYSTLYVDNSNSDDAWTLSGSGPYVLNSAKDSGKKLQYSGGVFTVGTGSGDAYNMDFYIPYISYADFRTTCCEKHAITNGEGDTDEGSWTAADITELCTGAELGLLAEGKPGYNFAAWEISKTSDESDVTDNITWSESSKTDAAATIIMPAYGITVNATFAAKTYTVTFDKNGGTTDGSATATYMSDALTSVSHATHEGDWNLAGYYTANTEGTQVIDANGNLVAGVTGYTNADGKWIRNADETTLYAQWIYAGTKRVTISPYTGGTVTVSWNAGANLFTSGYQDIAEETVLTITAVPTTPGYTLTSLTVGGNAFTSGDTHTLTEDVTVTAVFTPVAYSITYENMEGATNHKDNVDSYTIEAAEDVLLNDASKTGYHFDGWFTDNGTWENQIMWIDKGSTGNVVVYAKWTANEYTVTLNKQGGTGGGSATITATFDSEMPTLSYKPGKSGYTFQGYYGETNGGGTQYYYADKTSAHVWDQATNEASIYAYWTPNQTTITLNNEGASTAGTTEVVATYDAAPTAINVPEKTDYVFGGYWTEASGAGSQLIDAEGNWIANVDGYTGAEKVWKLNAATLELHAFWKQSFTMTFAKGAADATGDAPDLDGTSAYTGDLVTLPANTYSRDADYYRFSEWAVEDVNGDPVAVTNGKFTMPASNVTITAQWWEVPELARTYTSNVEMTYATFGANNETIVINDNDYPAWKAGKNGNVGQMKITLPAGATALHFHAVAWNGKTATLALTGVSASQTSFELHADAGASGSSPYTLTGDPIGEHYFYFTFDQLNAATEVTLSKESGNTDRFIIYGANAIYPEIKLNPTEFDFNTVRANDTKSQVFEITTLNGVSGTLAASITDDAGNNYSVSSIVDGKVTVTFDPKGAESGTFTAKLRVVASNASVTADLTATAIPATQPEITVDRNAIDFGRIEPNDAASETVAVELAYIDEDGVTASLSGTDAAKFSLSTTKLTANGDLVISKNTTAIGIYSATLTLSATGATNVVIPLTIKVTNKWAETYSSNVTISAAEDKNVKVGSSNTTYPAVKASSGGSATIQLPKGTQKLHFHVVAWNGESANVTISGSCFGSSKVISSIQANSEVSGTKGTYTFTEAEVLSYYHELDIENEIGTGGTTVTIQATSGKRFVLFGVNEEGGIHVLPAGETSASTLPSEINLLVEDGKTLNVNATTTLDNLTVEAGGKVSGTANLTVNNLTINSEAGKSGQIANADKVTANAVYMDVRFYSKNDATALGADEADVWYSISAPFEVNLNGGFIDIASGEPMVFGQDFDLFEYDGSKRATTGVTGWKRAQGKMKAGVACLIGFNESQPTTIRLKAASTTLSNPGTIDLKEYASASDANANWNGVANPTLHYTTLDKDAQYFNNNTRGWETCTPSANSFVVGSAFFVHSKDDITLSNTINNSGLRAPKHYEDENLYEVGVRITSTTDQYSTNNMYVRASEEAQTSYQAGHDLQTLNGETAACALIYAKNYGMRLAIEEAPIVNGEASYEIGMYAPANGEYRIEANDTYDNADLYLTQNGTIIWNLSMSEYTVDLNKGTTNGYGLLLRAKAPAVVTGVDQIDAKAGAQKVIIDEHVYILRGGQMYDVNGKMVK